MSTTSKKPKPQKRSATGLRVRIAGLRDAQKRVFKKPSPTIERSGTAEPISKADALARAKAALAAMTDAEDAAITKAALADPDAQPVDELFNKGGRPRSENPKVAVSLRLDRDVIDSFRKRGPGWQTRVNEALRKASGLDD